MAQIDVGDAAMAGVRIIIRQPFSVLTWGLLMAVLVALLFLMFGGGLAASISAIIAAGEAGTRPSPAEILGLVAGAFGFIFLLVVGVQLLDLIFRAAAMRAELEPEAHTFAYMRFGAQELWLLAASVVFWLVLFGANIVMSIPLGVLAAMTAVGTIASASQGSAPDLGMLAGFAGIRLIGNLVILAVTIWLWLRLSLGIVMTFRERRFALFESWAATRGHVWRMFLAMLLVFLMLAAVSIVLWIIGIIAFGVTIASAGMDPRAFFSRPPAQWLAALTPLFVVILLAIVVNVGVGNALVWGAVARMWRQLNPDADVAKTFT